MARHTVGANRRGTGAAQQGLSLPGRAVRPADDLSRLRRNLVDVLGHEMRTPLTVILGFADLLLDGIDGPVSEGQRQAVTAMRDAALREMQLLEDALVLARTRSDTSWLRMDRVEMGHIVATVLENLAPAVRGKGLELVQDIRGDIWVSADAVQLRRAVDHLVANALKFTPRGTITVRCCSVGGDARLEVEDTGIGMSTADVGGIFEEFHQVDQGTTRRFGGAGIGLAVVRALVEAHGGRFQVTSTPGAGSTFTVTLPAAAGPG
jgi:signal transduction histidine kinase